MLLWKFLGSQNTQNVATETRKGEFVGVGTLSDSDATPIACDQGMCRAFRDNCSSQMRIVKFLP